MSLGEYRNIKAAIGSIDGLIDEKSKAYEKCFIKYLASKEAVEEKFEKPALFKNADSQKRQKKRLWAISLKFGRNGNKFFPKILQ